MDLQGTPLDHDYGQYILGGKAYAVHQPVLLLR